MSLSDGHDGSLVVVLFKVDHTLDAPVDSQRTFQHDSPVNLTRLHFEAFGIEELIISFELRFDLIARNRRTWRVLRRWISLLAEAFVRLDASSMAEQLRTKQCSVAWNVAVRHLKKNSILVTSGCDPDDYEYSTYAFVLSVLAWIEPFTAFMAAQALWVPVES